MYQNKVYTYRHPQKIEKKSEKTFNVGVSALVRRNLFGSLQAKVKVAVSVSGSKQFGRIYR